LPPADIGNLIWAWDPDLTPTAAEAVIGPAGTLVTPVRSAGPPAFYTFGALDNINYGDSLDSTWTNGTGWTVHIAINPSAGDIAAGVRLLASKGFASAGHGEWSLWWIVAGQPSLRVFYGGGTGNFEQSQVNVAVTAARHVISATWDHGQAFGSRVTIYVDGVAVAQTRTSGGVDGTISDLVDALFVGCSDGASVPVSRMSYVYAYNIVESPANVATNANWIKTVKGWT
jgi:hypothetical protein